MDNPGYKMDNPKSDMENPAYEKDYSLFPARNLLMMAGCLALVIIGFILMSGGSSSVEGGFNPDIFSTRRIVVGPTIAFLGFLLMAFAIIIEPRKRKKHAN